MPPIRSEKSTKSIEQEGRTFLAVSAIQKKEISSISGAARYFQVPRSTLRDRIYSHTNRSETRPNNYKLTAYEDDSLLQ